MTNVPGPDPYDPVGIAVLADTHPNEPLPDMIEPRGREHLSDADCPDCDGRH